MTRRKASPDSEARVAHLGRVLRNSREGRMTVEELADAAEVSSGLISQLERGIGNPSFHTLMCLSRALDLPIAAFFPGGTQYEAERIIVRRNERRKLVMATNGDEDGPGLELLTPETNRRLGMVWTTVPPHFSTEDTPMAHVGEEVFLVVEGQLEVYLDGSRYQVGTGDSISFDSSVPHAYANTTRRPAVFLGCSTPPTIAGCYSNT